MPFRASPSALNCNDCRRTIPADERFYEGELTKRPFCVECAGSHLGKTDTGERVQVRRPLVVPDRLKSKARPFMRLVSASDVPDLTARILGERD